jgi:hypothetical protein
VLIGCVLALVVAEGVLRLAGRGPVGHEVLARRWLHRPGDPSLAYHCYPTNDHGEFEPAPELVDGDWRLAELSFPERELPLDRLTETPWCVSYRRDAQGVRGTGVVSTAASGVLRIAGIGDSFALGEGVPFERTLFEQLERELEAEGVAVEIPNLGRGGADLRTAVDEVARATRELGARRALVVVTPNDMALTYELRERTLAATAALVPGGSERPWWARTAVGHAIRETAMARTRSDVMIETYLDAYDPAVNDVGFADMRARMRRLASLENCRVAVVAYPLFVRLDDYPLGAVGSTVVALAEEAGLPALDLSPAFRGLDARTLHVHELDQHPNGRAHGIAAAVIAEWLRTVHPAFLAPDDE